MTKSDLESLLYFYIIGSGLPAPECEYRFCKRMWRFDFAWPDNGKIAAECNGGIYKKGRHSFGTGLEKDYEKLNQAQLLGWKVLQFSKDQVENGYAIKTLEEALCSHL